MYETIGWFHSCQYQSVKVTSAVDVVRQVIVLVDGGPVALS
jgi:hypothetical protein